MSKKVNPATEEKKTETTAKSQAAVQKGAAQKPSAASTKKKNDEKAPSTPKLNPSESAAELLRSCQSLPESFRKSFASKVESGKDAKAESLQKEFREALPLSEKSAGILEVFETERKEGREYRYWLSLAANTSGFDKKTRDQLAAASLAGKREQLTEILHTSILQENDTWKKIDEAIGAS